MMLAMLALRLAAAVGRDRSGLPDALRRASLEWDDGDPRTLNDRDPKTLNEASMHEAKQIDPTYAAATPASPEALHGIVRVPAWELFPWLRHGFSTRAGGVSSVYRSPAGAADSEAPADPASDLNLGWTADDAPELVAENRRRFTRAIWPVAANDTPPALITVRQIHSAVTMVVAGEDPAALVSETGRALCEGDGLITTTPGVLLGVQTADCVPVLVVDTERRIVAAFHAGWRGTVARIVEHGVTRLQREFGSRPESLTAAIGPSIGACCYTVGAEVHSAFQTNFHYADALFRPALGSAQYMLDLWEANRRQLVTAGVAAARITVLGECTGCAGLPARRRYFSHRLENGFTGRMLSVVGIDARY
jgi:polyphenol oxidase